MKILKTSILATGFFSLLVFSQAQASSSLCKTEYDDAKGCLNDICKTNDSLSALEAGNISKADDFITDAGKLKDNTSNCKTKISTLASCAEGLIKTIGKEG